MNIESKSWYVALGAHLRCEKHCNPHYYERCNASNPQTHGKPVYKDFPVCSIVWAEIKHVRSLFWFCLRFRRYLCFFDRLRLCLYFFLCAFDYPCFFIGQFLLGLAFFRLHTVRLGFSSEKSTNKTIQFQILIENPDSKYARSIVLPQVSARVVLSRF